MVEEPYPFWEPKITEHTASTSRTYSCIYPTKRTGLYIYKPSTIAGKNKKRLREKNKNSFKRASRGIKIYPCFTMNFRGSKRKQRTRGHEDYHGAKIIGLVKPAAEESLTPAKEVSLYTLNSESASLLGFCDQ